MGCRGSAHLINGRLVSVISEVCFLCVRRGHANGGLSIMFTAKLDPTALPPAGLSCLAGLMLLCDSESRLVFFRAIFKNNLIDHLHPSSGKKKFSKKKNKGSRYTVALLVVIRRMAVDGNRRSCPETALWRWTMATSLRLDISGKDRDNCADEGR